MSNPIDWSKQPRKYQEFAGKLGLGPLYEPKPEAKRKCPKCGEHSAVVRERHPDTDMNHMALSCLDCGFEKEL